MIQFITDNADFFYHIYAYWHNFSNKPIRCSSHAIARMHRSQTLQADDIYTRHQIAKFDELRRKAQGELCRKIYLVD